MASKRPGRTELPLQYFLENEYQSLIEIFHWVTNLAGSVYTDTTAVVPPEAVYASAPFSGAYSRSQNDITLTGDKSWKTARFELPGARLLNSQNGGADLRLVVEGGELVVNRAALERR